ncbi:liprin-beta-2 isoform X4 [Anguilla anguilla]|uniref:liprin-beta-2 isoform X4 n=1 Tax=Anguilla anguilla TaxID=7936 RepID=UPI0015ABE128|nr:liprin-beta-2 isoform X4 [Anguilla anguilla]
MSSDASHMLEAALEQMDDIIAGSKAAAEFGGGGLFDLGSPAYPGPQKVLQLAEDLRAAIEMQAVDGDRVLVRKHLPNNTAEILMQWLERGMVNLQVPVNNETYQDRLSRLEGDKESLVLQVSVLTEQVEAQGEKIRDLESSLDEHQHKLSSTEEMLQQELFSRTSLETEKLDLMDEVSHLKLKLVGMEDQPSEGDSKQHKAEGLLTELKVLKCKVNELQEEKCQYEKKLKATKAEISDLQQLLAEKDAEIDCLQRQLTTGGPATATGADKDQELQRLKTGMETLLAENEEKGRRIEELTFLLNQYRKTKEVISSIQVSGARILSNSNTPQSEMSSCGSSPLMVSSSSFQKELDFSCRSVQMSPESAVSPSNTSVQNGLRIQPNTLSSSLEDLRSGSKKKHAVEEPVEPVVSAETSYADDSNKSQTMPGKGSRSCPNGKKEKHSTPIQKSPNQSRDSAFALNRCRSASAPVLGKAEKKDGTTFAELSLPSSGTDSKQQSPTSPDNRKNQKAIHRFWGRVRKSQSGFLPVDDLDPAEFRRGGVRATAGPRLAQTDDSASSIRDMNTPFSNWTKEQVCGWLEDYGLGQYVNLARQWVNTGQTLLSATPQQLEKEIGIKNSLHRKKLQLALRSFNTKVIEKSSELDHIWVTRWLDDIGLPQYKDQFNDGRVDGRMIQYLTVNDLLFLKVTSQLHHLSIKCAIHVLHINKFNPHCLRRRPGDENKTSPSEVMQWSNHRVMEWLRSVDLAEYAPNLRGSGVHGGLIILEPRFNSDTLAMLLNIPPQKTLLRRHLATNFSSLVGPQAQQEKRECMCSSGYNPLTTTAKVRPKKLGFTTFGHLRRKKLDDSTDYICPLDTPPPPINGGVQPYSGFRGLSPILDRDREKKDQVGQKSGSHQASTHRS